jgi:hypothetical protein
MISAIALSPVIVSGLALERGRSVHLGAGFSFER